MQKFPKSTMICKCCALTLLAEIAEISKIDDEILYATSAEKQTDATCWAQLCSLFLANGVAFTWAFLSWMLGKKILLCTVFHHVCLTRKENRFFFHVFTVTEELNVLKEQLQGLIPPLLLQQETHGRRYIRRNPHLKSEGNTLVRGKSALTNRGYGFSMGPPTEFHYFTQTSTDTAWTFFQGHNYDS